MIDLGKYCSATIVLSGRTKGEKIRKELQLQTIDKEAEPIAVEVPLGVVSMNSSFFLGLFGPSVRQLGAENFKRKYMFKARPAVVEDVNRGIRDALKSHVTLV